MFATHHALLELVSRLTLFTANDRDRVRILQHTNLNFDRLVAVLTRGFDDLRFVLRSLGIRHGHYTKSITLDQQAITGLEFYFQPERPKNQ